MHTVEEAFWVELADKARRSGGLGLKHLVVPRLTFVEFLSSFNTLEELEFSSGFHTYVLSSVSSTASEVEHMGIERRPVDEFFKVALLKHKDTLHLLSFSGFCGIEEAWNLNWEYLECRFNRRGLMRLNIPVCHPVDYSVSSIKNSQRSVVLSSLPNDPILRRSC